MVEIINQHIELIQVAIQKLEYLKKWILTIEKSTSNERIVICISDIDRCIETGNYYNNHTELFNPSVFSYDSMLVKMADTVKDNNFGVVLSEEQEKVKQLICSELFALVEQLILVNNKLTKI